MAGLLYIKQTLALSDEKRIERWVANAYWRSVVKPFPARVAEPSDQPDPLSAAARFGRVRGVAGADDRGRCG